MTNSSATGGYLTPDVSPPSDAALDDILQAMVVGITSLPGSLVRPRYQVKPPRQPAIDADWCAIGATLNEPDAGPALQHDPDAEGGLGVDFYARHSDIRALASFYGPNAERNALLLQDGLAIPQNIEVLQTYLMTFVNSGTIRRVPSLVNQQWVAGYDIELRFRRKTERVYRTQNIVSADVEFFDEADFRATT